ncbi:branched-chain amino acid ABC transporter permease [Ramlibacter sp.]|uniref:branched-chain amino acid ABC transporter permease n=1 Tax=Ramlibacter sp. TaxID=1917967 RepID=UPI003D0F7966
MDLFLSQVFSGIATGAIYGCVGLAMVMIFTSTEKINFAQGEMATFSTYVAWTLMTVGLPYWGAFAAAVALSFAGGVLIQRVLLTPLNNAPEMSQVIVFFGLFLVFNSVAGWIWGYLPFDFPSPLKGFNTGTTLISAHQLFIMLVAVIMLTLLFVFFRYTALGLCMRAAAQNPVSARLMGIRVGWMLALGWGLSAAVGAVAGIMVAPVVFLEPQMMVGVLLYAFAAALVGGIDSPPGAFVGGIIVGVLENLVGTYFVGTDLKLTVALVLIIAVLIFRPTGLFGSKRVVRV